MVLNEGERANSVAILECLKNVRVLQCLRSVRWNLRREFQGEENLEKCEVGFEDEFEGVKSKVALL